MSGKMTSLKVSYNFLGRSGLRVSNICLGTMTFGKSDTSSFKCPTQSDDDLSYNILDRFAQLGGNFIDTADIYEEGKSEEIVGHWLKTQDRSKFVIATKVRFNMDPSQQNKVGLSRTHILEGCEASLRRLQLDYIDLYQAHAWDEATPVEVTLRTFDDLIRCGKIRYYGYSNVTGWQMQKIMDTAASLNLNKPITLQQQYNLLSRYSEYEAFRVCENEGLAILPWSPLKGGALTGKFKRNEVPDPSGSRIGFANKEGVVFQNFAPWSHIGDNDQYWNLIKTLGDIAISKGKTIAQVSLRWLLQRQNVASVVIGATSIAQLEDNMEAGSDWELSKEEMQIIEEASPIENYYPYEMVNRVNRGRINTFNK